MRPPTDSKIATNLRVVVWRPWARRGEVDGTRAGERAVGCWRSLMPFMLVMRDIFRDGVPEGGFREENHPIQPFLRSEYRIRKPFGKER